MVKSNIVLIGFMGTGKSTVGRHLALRLGWEFVDTDIEVERVTGLSILDIFDRWGEERFRWEETLAVQRVARGQRQVVATGGGVVLKPANVEALQGSGLLVALSASPEVILRRVGGRSGRPLLKGKSPAQVAAMLAQRAPYYRVADFQVDTSGLDVAAVGEQVLDGAAARGWQVADC